MCALGVLGKRSVALADMSFDGFLVSKVFTEVKNQQAQSYHHQCSLGFGPSHH